MPPLSVSAALSALHAEGQRDDPYPIYAALHASGTGAGLTDRDPMYHAVGYGYEVVEKALRNPALRVSDAGQLDRTHLGWKRHPVWRTLMGSMMFANPPEHTRMRKLIAQVFTPRRIAALEPAVHRLTSSMLDRLAAQSGPVDFLADFAFPLPNEVMCELLGVPQSDRGWFRPQVDAIGTILDLGGGTKENVAVADAAAVALREYFAELAARRRAAPEDDLISSLVQAGLAEDELLGNIIVLFNAGFVTTTHLLGNGLALLLQHPDVLAAVRADPALVPGLVEEVLRYEAPVQVITRWAAEPTKLGELEIPHRKRVLLLLGAGNRDPRRFTDPDVFDVGRANNSPLSFGAGIHYCIGAALSRMEGRLAFPMLLSRFPGLTLAEAPTRSGELTLRGYAKLPITL
jgi:cytochrome P450